MSDIATHAVPLVAAADVVMRVRGGARMSDRAALLVASADDVVTLSAAEVAA